MLDVTVCLTRTTVFLSSASSDNVTTSESQFSPILAYTGHRGATFKPYFHIHSAVSVPHDGAGEQRFSSNSASVGNSMSL